MAAKKGGTKRAVTKTASAAETYAVPRSAKALGEAILRRSKRSPNYWAEVARVVMAGTGSNTTQAEPRTQH